MTNNPKPGDRLTAEQARALPDGAVVAYERTVGPTDVSASTVRHGIELFERVVTLVSLPTPPDMAPGSVVLDEDGVAWVRSSGSGWPWHTHHPELAPCVAAWSDLAPRVVKVLHDAAVTA